MSKTKKESNAKYAYPEIDIVAKDRVRTFCFDMYALEKIEEYFSADKPDYSVFTDFPWYSNKITDINIMVWAGFANDARQDDEIWTIEKCKGVIDFSSLPAIKGLLVEAFSRILPPEQKKKLEKATKQLPKKTSKKK